MPPADQERPQYVLDAERAGWTSLHSERHGDKRAWFGKPPGSDFDCTPIPAPADQEDRRMSARQELLEEVRQRQELDVASRLAGRAGRLTILDLRALRALEVLAEDVRGAHCEAAKKALAILRGSE